MSCIFFVPGLPVSQGSKRAIVHKHTGRPVLIESANKALKSWRNDVRCQAMAFSKGPAVRDPINLQLEFILPKPKSARGRPHPFVRPDLSKMIRAVEDALTGIIFADDAQICSLVAVKRYQNGTDPSPGVFISVERKL